MIGIWFLFEALKALLGNNFLGLELSIIGPTLVIILQLFLTVSLMSFFFKKKSVLNFKSSPKPAKTDLSFYKTEPKPYLGNLSHQPDFETFLLGKKYTSLFQFHHS